MVCRAGVNVIHRPARRSWAGAATGAREISRLQQPARAILPPQAGTRRRRQRDPADVQRPAHARRLSNIFPDWQKNSVRGIT